jgi:predicted nucleotide-binding protein
MAERPYVFIGSSTAALGVANVIQAGLRYDAETMVWNQGLFRPGMGVLETLLAEASKFDFAVLVLRAEDVNG